MCVWPWQDTVPSTNYILLTIVIWSTNAMSQQSELCRNICDVVVARYLIPRQILATDDGQNFAGGLSGDTCAFHLRIASVCALCQPSLVCALVCALVSLVCALVST